MHAWSTEKFSLKIENYTEAATRLWQSPGLWFCPACHTEYDSRVSFSSCEHTESPEFPTSYTVSKNGKHHTVILQHFQNNLILIGCLTLKGLYFSVPL